MTHHPDMQKEAILKAHKAIEYEMIQRKNKAWVDEIFEHARSDAVLKKQRIGEPSLSGRFESILNAPDYTPEERRRKLLAWAHQNKQAIIEKLKS